jgi:hypothetical protein
MKTLYLIVILVVLYLILKPAGYVAASGETILSTIQIQKLLNIQGSDMRHRCAAQNYGRALNMKNTGIQSMPHLQFINNYVTPLMANGLSLDQGFLKCCTASGVKLT